MPRLNGVIETSLYVDDLERARRFYEEIFNLAPLFADNRLIAYDVGGKSVLLLFQRGASLNPTILPGGVIPAHDGRGPLHFAFAIAAGELDLWEKRLKEKGVQIEGRIDWPRGGKSIYFRDPDGHVVELATPGLWAIY